MGLCCALRVVGVCRYVKVVANGWRVWRIGFASAVAEVDIGTLVMDYTVASCDGDVVAGLPRRLTHMG